MTIFHSIINFIQRWWFSPMPGTRLAAVRWVVGLFAIWYSSRRIDLFHDVASGDDALFEPIGVVSWMSAPMDVAIFDGLVILMLALAIAFTVGFNFRWTGPAFAAVLLFVLTYRNSWSMIYHSDNACWLHVMILSITPSADRWSVDAWRRRKNQIDKKLAMKSGASGNYGWPLRLMAMVTGVAYFLAGIAKVTSDLGWGWAGGGALRSQIAVDGLRKELFGSQAPDLAFWLYDSVWLFTLMGVGTLVLEIGAPLFVANRLTGKLWAIQTWFMHIGIWLIMGIKFEYCLTACVFAFAFDLEKPVESVGRRLRCVFALLRQPQRVRSSTAT